MIRRRPHPVVRLQHSIGNTAVGRLIQAQRASTGFERRDGVAVQIMHSVLSGRSAAPPDFAEFSVALRPEHKEWILQLWSAATGQRPVGTTTLTMPERHEALASGMRGALRLADRYALEGSTGRQYRVKLREAMQALRRDLYATASPGRAQTFGLGFGFVPKILEIGNEPQQARKASPLSSQPAELREVVYLSFPSRATPKEPEQWFNDLTDRQKSAFTSLYNALRAKDLVRFIHTIHDLDHGEAHFWGVEQEGNTVSLKVIGDTDGLNARLGDPLQGEIALDSPFMAMMHKGQKSYRELTSGAGLHISVGPGKYWDVHLDAHPPVRGQEAESDAERANRLMLHGLQELFPNMPRTGLAFLLKKIRIPPDLAKKIANKTLPAIRFFPATDSPLWRSKNHAEVMALDIQAVKQEGREMTATVGISGRF